MRRLELKEMTISNFDIPCSWRRLEHLDLAQNCLTELPNNMSHLVSLTYLNVQHQKAEFQVTSFLQILTQLQKLNMVFMSQGHPWTASSHFAIMAAQLALKSTPQRAFWLMT